MSAAPSATMRRAPATTRPAPNATAQAMHAAPAIGCDSDEEFRLDLRDIPRIRESMDIDNLKPTLLSRLLDLIAPLKP